MITTLQAFVSVSYYKKPDAAVGYLTLKNIVGTVGTVVVKASPEQAKPLLDAAMAADGVNVDLDLSYVDKTFGQKSFTEVTIAKVRSCKSAKVTVG